MEDFADLALMTFTSSMIYRFRCQFFRVALATLFLLAFDSVSHAQESVFELDPANTKIEFTLGASLHTVHGSFKLKSGTIRFDPSTGAMSGAIVINARSGESGNSSRDKRMHGEILESEQFPEIIFTPKQLKGALVAEGSSKLEVTGQIRLHGQDHEVLIPVEAQSSVRELEITTSLVVPYVQWGLKNPSTFLLRVSNKVTIDIRASGRMRIVRTV